MFSLDGKALASGGSDETVRLWDVVAGKESALLKGRDNASKALAFSPDGQSLAEGDSHGLVKVWDLATKTGQTKIQPAESGMRPGCLAYTKEGKLLAATLHRTGTVTLWDVTAGKEIVTFNPHNAIPDCVAYSPDAAVLAPGGRDGAEGAVKLWDAATGQQKATLGYEDQVTCVALSPDGRALAAGTQTRNHENQTLHLTDVASGREFAALKGHDKPISCVQFSPDGKTLASASHDSTIRLWSVPPRRSPNR